MSNPTRERLSRKKPLIGLAVSAYDPLFIEIAARTGFDAIWIEMEHSGPAMPEVENMVRLIQGNGMLSIIRLPGVARETVLRAAETGVDMLIAPMTNTPEAVEELVRNARYKPVGSRGYFGSSRALNFGMGAPMAELRRRANERLTLWAQVETREALAGVDGLAGIAGVDGLFVGPGDLSAELATPGELNAAAVTEAIETSLATCRAKDRLCGLVCPPDRVGQWAKRGMDLLVIASSASFYIRGATALRQQVDQQLADIASESGGVSK